MDKEKLEYKEPMDMSLKKGIAVIFGANLLNLIFNLLTNFLLPQYLSVDCYAEIKTFQLYVGYSGILHLGYEDGMYIKYGGKTINQLNAEDFKTDLNTLFLFQFILTFVLIVGASSTGNLTLITCAMAVFPLNIMACYTLLFQAIGEFGSYANVSNVKTALTFAVNISLLLLNCFTKYQYYLISYVIIYFFLMLFCIRIFHKKQGILLPKKAAWFSWKMMTGNIGNGIFLMLGNFSSMILTGMDRWFIKALMNNTAFAMYSFAVSMEGLMNVAVTPVSATLYNYFCCHENENELFKVKGKIILFATAVVSCAFPAKFILEIFLTKYIDAAKVMFYLFGAQIFYIIVKCFYVNLYKAQKRQKIYFIKLTTVIIAGFALNAGLYALLRTKEAFAIGTMFCGIIWYIFSELDFPLLQSGLKENIFLILATASYILLGMFVNSLVGFAIYILLLLLYSIAFMKEDFEDCIQILKKIIKTKSL